MMIMMMVVVGKGRGRNINKLSQHATTPSSHFDDKEREKMSQDGHETMDTKAHCALTSEHILERVHVQVAIALAKFLAHIEETIAIVGQRDALLDRLGVQHLAQMQLPVGHQRKGARFARAQRQQAGIELGEHLLQRQCRLDRSLVDAVVVAGHLRQDVVVDVLVLRAHRMTLLLDHLA